MADDMLSDEAAGALVDLHCHILPGIDDGAVDLDDSFAMAAQAVEDGIGVICATPHIRHDHDVIIDELPGRVGELNGELGRRGMPVRVVAGGEVAETIVDHLDRSELESVALGGKRWILLEPAPGPLSDGLDRVVADLHGAGFRCLIAHPERHMGHDLVPRLRGLIDLGALVQATAAFLADPETAGGMLDLGREGLIHVLGSDAHSSRFGRRLQLSAGLARLAEVEPPASHLDWIAATAPRGILEEVDLEPPFRPRPGD